MNSNGRDIIVIGASAGGVEALITITSALPRTLPAAVFVAMHVPPWRDSFLPEILSRRGALPAEHPASGTAIEHGRVYVAPPDYHLLLRPGDEIELWRGPKENNCRPSINAMFRSAASAYGPRVTGVVLTGALDDGAAGLWWIKRMAGTAVVQDPADAEFAQMLRAALSHVPADFALPAAKIGSVLAELANGHAPGRQGEVLPQ